MLRSFGSNSSARADAEASRSNGCSGGLPLRTMRGDFRQGNKKESGHTPNQKRVHPLTQTFKQTARSKSNRRAVLPLWPIPDVSKPHSSKNCRVGVHGDVTFHHISGRRLSALFADVSRRKLHLRILLSTEKRCSYEHYFKESHGWS